MSRALLAYLNQRIIARTQTTLLRFPPKRSSATLWLLPNSEQVRFWNMQHSWFSCILEATYGLKTATMIATPTQHLDSLTWLRPSTHYSSISRNNSLSRDCNSGYQSIVAFHFHPDYVLPPSSPSKELVIPRISTPHRFGWTEVKQAKDVIVTQRKGLGYRRTIWHKSWESCEHIHGRHRCYIVSANHPRPADTFDNIFDHFLTHICKSSHICSNPITSPSSKESNTYYFLLIRTTECRYVVMYRITKRFIYTVHVILGRFNCHVDNHVIPWWCLPIQSRKIIFLLSSNFTPTIGPSSTLRMDGDHFLENWRRLRKGART